MLPIDIPQAPVPELNETITHGNRVTSARGLWRGVRGLMLLLGSHLNHHGRHWPSSAFTAQVLETKLERPKQ